MKTIEFSGFIEFDWSGDFETIKLIQQDGFKIDLVNRFKEVFDTIGDKSVQVGYYTSDKPKTKDEMVEGFLENLYGKIRADYERDEYCYSSWTRGVDYDTYLNIGNHSLLGELREKEGKYLLLQLNIEENV